MTRLYGIVWICILHLLIHTCQEIEGLKCLQCNSLENKVCHLGKSEAKECPGKDQKYCITYSGALKESGTHILFRDCSTESMASDCQIVTVSDKGNETKPIRFRVCYHSCDTNGCNRDVHELSGIDTHSSAIIGVHYIHLRTLTVAMAIALIISICWSFMD